MKTKLLFIILFLLQMTSAFGALNELIIGFRTSTSGYKFDLTINKIGYSWVLKNGNIKVFT